jgi:hypothetical protein
MDRDRYAAGVVRDEVLAKQRRALIIFGSMHVTRRGNSVVGLLENDTGTRVFNVRNVTRNSFDVVRTIQPDLSAWPVPSLALVSDTVLTKTEFGSADAMLYVGPPSMLTFSRLPQSLCSDGNYVSMRRERMALTGLPQAKADELLARDCPTIVPR